MGWMCILVGGPGVGKTSLARTAAQLAGRKLTEIALTGGTDTADLLGGFEQLEPKRKVQVSEPCCACFAFKQQARRLFLHCWLHLTQSKLSTALYCKYCSSAACHYLCATTRRLDSNVS